MADETPQPQRRVLPARNRRESTAKREATSPAAQSPPTKRVKTEVTPTTEPRMKRKYVKKSSLIRLDSPSFGTPSTAGDEVLPTKVQSSAPLPTASSKQDADLPSNEYQSIAESAILAASLYRSRMQWLCDGVLKKYWTKPSKRKGAVEPPNNPDVKSMVKLGNATITIEPHTFEAVIYTVKDQEVPTPSPVVHQSKQHTPKPPYPPPNSIPPPPSPVPPSPVAPTPTPVQRGGDAAIPITEASIKQDVPTQPSPAAQASKPGSGAPNVAAKPTLATPVRPPLPPQQKQDPVIQMLAARAAMDSRLKDLMKVVAASKANPEQLKEFQAHIDEFNGVIRRQEAERAVRGKATPKGPANPSVTSVPHSSSAATTPSSIPSTPSTYKRPPAAMPPPPYMAYPPPPPPKPEPMVKHIVLEFTSPVNSNHSASNDRWLFPEHAVLDFRGQNEMLCSFFVERKGSELLNVPENEPTINAAKWKAGEEYYQPVTMTIKTNMHRIIETIARAAKSLPAVQEYMKEVLEKKKRAPATYLVHQLPRDKTLGSLGEFQDSGVDIDSGDEDDELRDLYGN